MNLTLQRVSKRTFRALALVRESLSRKANTRYIIFETLNSGRFTCILSTHLIKPNHFVGLSDRRSRTVSLETYPPHKKKTGRTLPSISLDYLTKFLHLLKHIGRGPWYKPHRVIKIISVRLLTLLCSHLHLGVHRHSRRILNHLWRKHVNSLLQDSGPYLQPSTKYLTNTCTIKC